MARNRRKGVKIEGQFLPLHMRVLQSHAFQNLSPYAAKLLLNMMSMWRLGHNGDISISFEKIMKPRGWRSKETLHNALNELLESGLIERTRQGGLGKCSLFALGWLSIDECGGKLDVNATSHAPNGWLRHEKIKVPSTQGVSASQKDAQKGTPSVPVT